MLGAVYTRLSSSDAPDCNGIVSPGTIAECKATGSKPSATAAGDAYTFGELGAMHREAGSGQVEAHPVPKSPHTVVTGIAR